MRADMLGGRGRARPGRRGSKSREVSAGRTIGGSGADTPVRGNGEEEEVVVEGDAKAAGEKVKPVWTGVTTTRSAKSQALEAMKALIAHQPIPVARARMRLRITCPNNILKQTLKTSSPKTDAEEAQTGTVKDKILSFVEQVESQDVSGEEWEVTGFVEPGSFKPLSEFVSSQTKGRARAEVLDMAVTHEGD